SLRYAEHRRGRVTDSGNKGRVTATGVQQTKRCTLREAEAEDNISCENFEISKSDDNSSTWYENELLWAPSTWWVHTVIHEPFGESKPTLHQLLAPYLSIYDDEISMLHEMAKNAWITVLSEATSHNSVNLT
ncbi:hypothetical protein HID58_032960, partial [Brassica napus]